MSEQVHPKRLYLINYLVLLALLALTVGMSYVDFGRGYNNTIAIGIGFIKAILIMLFFMHIWYEPSLMWVFAATGFFFLGIMLVLTMSDYLTRNHPPGMSPKGEPVFLTPDKPRNAIPYSFPK